MRVSLGLLVFLLISSISLASKSASSSDSQTEPRPIQWLDAMRGDSEAQLRVGECYRDGEGVEKDATRAVWWFKKAAEQGNAKAKIEVAKCLLAGFGVEADPAKGFEILDSLRKQNNAEACVEQGICYAVGRGVPQDKKRATECYLQGACLGHVDAKARAGDAILKGWHDRLGAQDGLRLHRDAAQLGHVYSQSRLALLLWHGASWHSDVLADKREAAIWAKKAADAGDADAQCIYALCLEHGEGVPKDHEAARKYLLLAANQDCAWAQRLVAVACKDGKLFVQDLSKSFNWMDLAASNGDWTAQRLLATYHAKGIGTEKNPTEAIKWYQKTANTGDPLAQSEFAFALFNGNGIPKRMDKAVEWHLRSANQGNLASQGALAAIYESGIGAPVNLERAYFWMCLRAGATGDPQDRRFLRQIEEQLPQASITVVQREAAKFKPVEEPFGGEVQQVSSSIKVPQHVVCGSGFFVTSDGYFVTNQHVIENAKKISVRVDGVRHDAVVVRVDAERDLAVLKINGEFTPLFIRGSRGLRVAAKVSTVGFPNAGVQGNTPKYSSGEVAALSGINDDPGILQISVPIQGGNSGGPLVDNKGSVVGVIVARLNKMLMLKNTGTLPENVNYAIKGSVLLDVLETIPEVSKNLLATQQEFETPEDVAAHVTKASAQVICLQ